MEELKSGIYKITCSENGRVYVGQAINIKDRWMSHMQCLNRNKHHNIHLQRAWNKYGEECFKFEVIEYCEPSNLNDREIHWIKELNSFKNGYNRTLGGGGILGRKYTKQEIKNRTGKNNPFYNKKHKDGWLDKVIKASNEKTSKPILQISVENGEIINKYNSISEASRKYNCSVNAIRLCIEGVNKRACGYYWILENNYDSFNFKPFKNESIRKVCQIDFESGVLLEIFDSLSEASKKVNIISSSITDCCRGKQKSCAGYFWKYYENGDENKEYFEVPIRKETKRKVVQLSLDGEFIRLFDSRTDAERKTGICSTSISQVCNGVYKQTNGYKWMNYEDYIEKYGEII